jgi:hypothetical protein
MAATLFALPYRPAFDSNAKVIPGAQLYFTLTGTNTASAPYTSPSLTTQHTNPVIADAAGKFPAIYLNSAVTYRVRLYEDDAEVGVDTPLEEYDPFTGQMVGALVVSIGTVTTGAPGSAAAATVDDLTGGAYRLNLTLPRGATGSGSSVAWGGVTGTLTDQGDLAAALNAKAALASPTFTGDPKAPTPATSDNDTSIATTAYVQAQTGGEAFGYRRLVPNAQAGAYALTAADNGKLIQNTTGGWSIPSNATLALPIGFIVTLYNDSASSQAVTITTDSLRLAGTGTTGTRTVPARGACTLLKVNTTEWIASGNVT